jgi:hypothetical protein
LLQTTLYCVDMLHYKSERIIRRRTENAEIIVSVRYKYPILGNLTQSQKHSLKWW